jgi:hypothetical protein
LGKERNNENNENEEVKNDGVPSGERAGAGKQENERTEKAAATRKDFSTSRRF